MEVRLVASVVSANECVEGGAAKSFVIYYINLTREDHVQIGFDILFFGVHAEKYLRVQFYFLWFFKQFFLYLGLCCTGHEEIFDQSVRMVLESRCILHT